MAAITPHTQPQSTCPACAELRAMMRGALSFETKSAILELLKIEQAKYHQVEAKMRATA